MKIRVDDEGQKAINELCDIALKAHGMQVLQGVVQTLNGVGPLPKEKKDGSTSGGVDPGQPRLEGSQEVSGS